MRNSLIEIDILKGNTENQDKLLKEVAACTHWNDNNKARLLIATYFNYSQYINIFTSISFIAKTLGFGHHDIISFREDMLKNMLSLIEIDYSKELRDKLHNCL